MTGDYQICRLGPADAAEALEVNRRCPIEADFRFYFERAPDFFLWPGQVFDSYEYAGVRLDGRLVGYALLGYRRGWTGGGWGTYSYGGDLRVLPEHRRKRLAEHLRAELITGFRGDVQSFMAIVKRGNRAAEGYVHSAERRKTEWVARDLGDLHVANLLMLTATARRDRVHEVRPAVEADLDALLELMTAAFRGRMFAPRPDRERVLRALRGEGTPAPPRLWVASRHGQLRAVVGAWNMASMHRAQVIELSARARWAARVYAAARLFAARLPALPRPGECFVGLTLVDVACRDRDPAALRAIVTGLIHAHAGSGVHFLHVGLLANDPLRAALDGLPRQDFVSNMRAWYGPEAVGAFGDALWRDPYLDLAIL